MPPTKKSVKHESKKWPLGVSIFEVGPRDGLQSEAKILTLEQRQKLIVLLMEAGLSDIEVGSFVRDDRIPQLAGSGKLMKSLEEKRKSWKGRFWAFVPNEVGLNHAVEAGVDGASFFTATSNTFCQKNVNRSKKELLDALGPLLKTTKKLKKKSRVYISTLTYCPYEGPIKPSVVTDLVSTLVQCGASELVLSDTTGDANPRSLARVFEPLLKKYSPSLFALHFHDTRGLGLVNIMEGMKFGIVRFDSSVGGMGGCPYAPGASGNLATEDLVNLLKGLGLLPGINLGLVAKAGAYAQQVLANRLPSRVLRTLENAQ